MHDRRDIFDSFDFDDEYEEWARKTSWWHRYNMRLWTWVGVGLVCALVVALLVRCCCRSRSGRVLAPPPHNASVPQPAPYPQQQFAPAHYPAPVVVPVVAPGYPAPAAFPPTQYPGAGPGGYYPPDAPYPGGYPMPQPAPTAPDVHAGPPSYSQVMGEKQPPYNPSAPH